MLITNLYEIGNKLQSVRKRAGLTQEEVAELAGISSRTYADLERGMVNPRLETVLRICETLHITPDEILTAEQAVPSRKQEELWENLKLLSSRERDTALHLLDVYLHSLS